MKNKEIEGREVECVGERGEEKGEREKERRSAVRRSEKA